MLARGLLGRFSAHVPKTTTHDLSNATYAALISQSGLSRQFLSSAYNALKLYSPALARSFATAQKARTVKPRTATKAKAAPKKKTTTKKAPAKKKAPVKSKAKKAKKVVKPKPRVRKVKTEKQVLAAEKRKSLDKVRELRALALKEPKGKPATVWNLVLAEECKAGGIATIHAGPAKEKYNNLTPAERENLNHIANQNKADNTIAYRAWVESHTPDQIRLANNARLQLKKLSKAGTARVRTGPPIRDERAPKMPLVPHLRFFKERYATGDFQGIKVTEATKLVFGEYKALPAGEKKRYEDAFNAERDQYAVNYKRVFGREPPRLSNSPAPTSP